MKRERLVMSFTLFNRLLQCMGILWKGTWQKNQFWVHLYGYEGTGMYVYWDEKITKVTQNNTGMYTEGKVIVERQPVSSLSCF